MAVEDGGYNPGSDLPESDGAKETSEPTFVASIEDDLVLGQEFPLKVCVQNIESGYTFNFQVIASGSVGLVNEEEWYNELTTDEKNQGVTFNLRVNSLGPGRVDVAVYHENRWLGMVTFDLDIEE